MASRGSNTSGTGKAKGTHRGGQRQPARTRRREADRRARDPVRRRSVVSLLIAGVAALAVIGVTLWSGFRAAGGTSRVSARSASTAARPPGDPAAGDSAQQARDQVPSAGETAPAHPAGPDPGWRLAFSSSFTGATLDTRQWATCYPWHDVPAGCTNYGNKEYEWYLPSQAQVRDGALQLTAQREPTRGQTANGSAQRYQCRSGMVTSYPSFRFQYGYVRITAKIPASQGLWPALWLAPASLTWPPEIDILEHWGTDTRARVGLHPAGAKDNFSYRRWFPDPALLSGWHTYGLRWTSSALIWYIDGKEMMSLNRDIPKIKMYLVMNLAESRKPTAASGCDGSLLIRSVKIWQP